MLQIKFCPQRVEDVVFDVIYDLNLDFDEMGDNERFKEIPEYNVRKIDDFDISGNRKEAEKLTKWAYEKFPWHFDVKREYYYRQLHAGKDLLFEDFFRKEIDCLENDQDYGRVVSDDELHAMLYSVGKHYMENGERQKLIDLYKKVECTQNPALYLELAVMITNKEEYNYSTLFYKHEDDYYEWVDIELPALFNDIHFDPIDAQFYTLLNTDMYFLTREAAQYFDTLSNKATIKHDILWLLKQGFRRTRIADSTIQFDFINYALYLTAAYEIEELYDYFIDLFYNMAESVYDIVFGDLFRHIISPAFLKIFDQMHGKAFDFLLEIDDFKWYFKSIYFQILASLYKHRDKSHYTYALIKRLFHKYDEIGDNKSLGWLFSAVSEIDCIGFEEEINAAFDSNKIDDTIHMNREQWQNNDYYFKIVPYLATFSQYVVHVKENFIVRKEDKDNSLEENLEQFLEPYEHQIDDMEDNYDDDDFDDLNDNILPLFSDPILPFKREEPKVGRNDACPCGSGKKYKKCCGK